MKKLLLLALAAGFPLLAARAEILIYDLSFDTSGPSVNYSFLQGGFLVVDSSSKAVSSIVTLTDPDTNLLYYSTGILSGSYMEMVAEGTNQEYAVLSSTSGGTTSENLAFQVLGKTSNEVNIGSGNALSIARRLRGYLLASAAESVTTDTSGQTTLSYGFAGASKVSAKFQSALTEEANNNRQDSAATIERLTQVLINRGVVPQPSPSPSPTATPTTTTLTTTL